MKRLSYLLATMLMAVPLVFVSCGGDDDDDTDQPVQPVVTPTTETTVPSGYYECVYDTEYAGEIGQMEIDAFLAIRDADRAGDYNYITSYNFLSRISPNQYFGLYVYKGKYLVHIYCEPSATSNSYTILTRNYTYSKGSVTVYYFASSLDQNSFEKLSGLKNFSYKDGVITYGGLTYKKISTTKKVDWLEDFCRSNAN